MTTFGHIIVGVWFTCRIRLARSLALQSTGDGAMRSLSMLPVVVLPLLLEVLQHVQKFDGPRDLDSVEYMAGEAQISHAVARRGLNSIAYDKVYHHTLNDINTKEGFHVALELALRVSRHGCIWCAPVCSSWVWIGRAGSGRTAQKAHGNPRVPRVRAGNVMVVRLVIIMIVVWLRGVHIFVENPMSTLVHYFSPFREVVETLLKHKTTVSLSAYGAPSRKAVTLWSTTPLVKTLHRVPGKARERLSIMGKDGSVTGVRAALKSSQAYPKAFGEAVAGVIRQIAVQKDPADLLDEDLEDMLVQIIADEGDKESPRKEQGNKDTRKRRQRS